MVFSRTTESWVCVGTSGGAGVGLGPVFDHKDTVSLAPVAPQLLITLACKDMCQMQHHCPGFTFRGEMDSQGQ